MDDSKSSLILVNDVEAVMLHTAKMLSRCVCIVVRRGSLRGRATRVSPMLDFLRVFFRNGTGCKIRNDEILAPHTEESPICASGGHPKGMISGVSILGSSLEIRLLVRVHTFT